MISVLLVVCAIGVAIGPLDAQDKIIGGQNAAPAVAPYIVSLRFNKKHYCAGSLIGSRIVVTAAHCVTNTAAENTTIRAGSNFRLRGGTVAKVASFRVHPSYIPTTSEYDLALIYLQQPLILSRTIRPIRLYSGRLVPKTNVLIYGWGYTMENGQNVKILQTAKIKIYDVKRCLRAYGGLLRRSMFCAGTTSPPRDSCDGDSGGPLVLKNRLAGVVSSGIGCGRGGSPGVYTNIPMLKRWIKTNS